MRLIHKAGYFEDERTLAKLAVLDVVTAEGAAAPPHWRTEVANAFVMGIRRGRVIGGRLDALFAVLGRLPVEIDGAGFEDLAGIVALAEHHGLTVYDAAYLDLAIRRHLPLATLDNPLADAARAASVPVLP